VGDACLLPSRVDRSEMMETTQPRFLPEESAAPLQESAFRVLKGMIEDGRLMPGQRLLEAQVAKAFGISRSPARRALADLLAADLVVERAGRGYQVVGAFDPGSDRFATLDQLQLSTTPQWERLYKEVEQELFIHALFESVQINELALSRHYDVSRTVTRDLLARMHGVGIVAKGPAGRWFAEQITPKRVRHLFELRRLLEPKALTMAAPHIPDAKLASARAHVEAVLRSLPPDSRDFDKAEVDLHIDLISDCPNPEIVRSLKQAHLLFGPTRHLFDPILGLSLQLIEGALREHLDIITRLQCDDASGAANALDQHLQLADERWMQRFDVVDHVRAPSFPPYLKTLIAE
jgi:DNA-binding GntR family transcriptional regulator